MHTHAHTQTHTKTHTHTHTHTNTHTHTQNTHTKFTYTQRDSQENSQNYYNTCITLAISSGRTWILIEGLSTPRRDYD